MCRYLLQRQSFIVIEDEYFAEIRSELLQDAVRLVTRFDARGADVGGATRVEPVECRLDALASEALAQEVVRRVRGDAVEPRAERRVALNLSSA